MASQRSSDVAAPFEERRRTARLPVDMAPECRLERSLRVRVVDLSASGALIWTDEELPVGSFGQLTVVLGDFRLHRRVRIIRVEPEASEGHLLGTVLTRSRSRQQQALEEFLHRRGS